LHTRANILFELSYKHANFYALLFATLLLACLFNFSSKKFSPIGFWSAPSARQTGEKNVRRENNFSRRTFFSPAGRTESADQKPIEK
jgi:hypothetical protein